jgi:hypothetical protein
VLTFAAWVKNAVISFIDIVNRGIGDNSFKLERVRSFDPKTLMKRMTASSIPVAKVSTPKSQRPGTMGQKIHEADDSILNPSGKCEHIAVTETDEETGREDTYEADDSILNPTGKGEHTEVTESRDGGSDDNETEKSDEENESKDDSDDSDGNESDSDGGEGESDSTSSDDSGNANGNDNDGVEADTSNNGDADSDSEGDE